MDADQNCALSAREARQQLFCDLGESLAGFGVRDLVMLELMIQWQLSKEVAGASVIVLRLAWLAAELAISAILYFCRPKDRVV